jgi:LysM repeat protein
MKPTLVKMAALFLVAVLVVAGLTGCDRSARERESEPTEPAATAQATQPGIGSETAAPGETVVSAVTPPSEGTGTVVAVTQAPAGETSEPEGQATAVPTEEAQPSPESGGVTEQQGGVIWHTVQQGETLASIARRYGTSWQAISQANSLVNPNQIYVGQKLKIPSGSTGSSSSGATGCRIRHTVRQGEWVWQIARNYGVSPYDILAANGLTIQSANNIQPGTVLCIP